MDFRISNVLRVVSTKASYFPCFSVGVALPELRMSCAWRAAHILLPCPTMRIGCFLGPPNPPPPAGRPPGQHLDVPWPNFSLDEQSVVVPKHTVGAWSPSGCARTDKGVVASETSMEACSDLIPIEAQEENLCRVTKGLLTEEISQAFAEARKTATQAPTHRPLAPPSFNVGITHHTSGTNGGRFERTKFRKPDSSIPPNIELRGGGRSERMCATSGWNLLSHLAVTACLCPPGACEICSVTCLVDPCKSGFPHA